MGIAYYNEKDPFAAEWLRRLIAANTIAPGDVDERSIEDVIPLEVAKYTQCHFFAGIGVWSYAMRCAGWPDDRHAWTGSCPCQPFSQAGQGAGFADERHLWPAFFHLIEQCRPECVFGEQVASPDGLAWLDLVQSDMEGTDYAFGAIDQCAAGFGAPHIRQRLYWMAYSDVQRTSRKRFEQKNNQKATDWPFGNRAAGGLAYDQFGGRESRTIAGPASATSFATAHGVADGMGIANGAGLQPWRQNSATVGYGHPAVATSSSDRCGPTNGRWRAADWLRCKDECWRPVEPGSFPLAHGVANRVGFLRGYGNAINAAQAEEFIKVAMEYAP